MESMELPKSPLELLIELVEKTPWRAEDVVVWGKKYPQPRLIAWYGDEGSAYTYSGIQLTPLPWTSLLLDIKSRVESVAKAKFNSVLLNYYRDNRDSMGMHSDDEPELGKQPTIASVSLGDVRALIFAHKTDRAVPGFKLRLASGSLLVMRGETQHNWKHGINKERQPCGPRVNLTFRHIAKTFS
jgi:alkylated DNA repair dioxygenase AlkB